MPVSTTTKIGYFKSLALSLAVLLLAAGCVNETLEECPPEPGVDDIRQLLYLRITDGATRGDITDTEYLDDIMVYLFDRNEHLVDTIPYTTSMIRRGVPVDLTDRNMAGGYVSVWANIGNSIEVTPAVMGIDIDDMEMSILANDSRADFFLCPGDMFFGYDKIAFTPVDELTEADTVWIERKNSRLNITVRGLPDNENAGAYYFRIESLYSAYNFEGTPLLEPRNIWEDGDFDGNGDYVSPEPYIMIHNAADHPYSDTNRVVVDLYRMAGTRADTLLASADRDTAGQYILLEKGKTTNVLIILEPQTGEVEVHMQITPWDEIHQWVIW